MRTDDEHFYRKIIVISGTQLHFVKKPEHIYVCIRHFPKIHFVDIPESFTVRYVFSFRSFYFWC